tara:strand:+ start:1529 stop:1807 length:279 start_codon:yes stop_codon:yes gene_type:complete
MKKTTTIIISLVTLVVFIGVFSFIMAQAYGAPGGKLKSKFYDFSDQLIDGEIKKPTALYTDSRQQVRFDRLIKLKKSFLPALLATSKDPVFK